MSRGLLFGIRYRNYDVQRAPVWYQVQKLKYDVQRAPVWDQIQKL
jgi:hypothetical protein